MWTSQPTGHTTYYNLIILQYHQFLPASIMRILSFHCFKNPKSCAHHWAKKYCNRAFSFTYRSISNVQVLKRLQLLDMVIWEISILGQLVSRTDHFRVKVTTDDVRVEVTACLGHKLLDGTGHLEFNYLKINVQLLLGNTFMAKAIETFYYWGIHLWLRQLKLSITGKYICG